MRLLQDQILRLDLISSYSEETLRTFLTQCGIPWKASDTKVMTFCPRTSLQGWSYSPLPLPLSPLLSQIINFSSDCTEGGGGLEASACGLEDNLHVVK